MENKTYTIKDIARLAGVSAGTVDRVLHQRGNVSESKRRQVQKVLDKIEYQPNVFAIGLAAKRPYRFVCLIPGHKEGDYWEAVIRGIQRAATEFNPFNVGVEYLYYDHADLISYQACCRQLLDNPADGVLIAPNFQEETCKLTEELDLKKIPYVLIDVNIERTHSICYIGQDSHVSGYIAAKLLLQSWEPGEEVALFLSGNRSCASEVQMQRRLEGFMSYLDEQGLQVPVHEVVLQPDATETNQATLEAFFTAHPQAVRGVVFNSRVYQVASYLRLQGRRLKGLVGYDLLERNIDYLQSGEADWLIGQRPALQGYCGVTALCHHVVFKKPVPEKQYMPIDVLMKENIAYRWMLDN